MSEIYNKDYYDQYDTDDHKVNYNSCNALIEFMDHVAEHIIEDFHPKTVLDAGCATGHLVSALRARGVETYGIDISDYAISQVGDDIRPYCFVGSLSDNNWPDDIPQKYDLIVTIEVLEHLYAEDGKKAIANLCKRTDAVLFASTPDDFEDRTHVNVQQREYWARLFFEQGFVDDINYRPRYLTHYATLFRRSDNIVRLIEDYERNIRMTEHEQAKAITEWKKAVNDKENHINNLVSLQKSAEQRWDQGKAALQSEIAQVNQEKANLQSEIAQINQEKADLRSEIAQAHKKINDATVLNEKLNQDLSHYHEHYHAAIAQREDLKRQLAELQNSYNVISNAFFWKITKPIRLLLDIVKRPLRKIAFFRLINKGVRCLHENGLKYTWRKVKNKLKNRQEYAEIAKKPLFTEQELESQRKHVFPRKIKFSIVVPLFNTPEKFLREMIQSVIDQTYNNWELCMADGSDPDHNAVEKICRQYAKKDSRIKYKKLEKNLGISGNTNACLDMTTGDYIGLFDHDDLLHPAALHEVMKAICEQGADFIYTDENTFHEQPKDAFCPHFKPDYAPDTLRTNNYICHFTVFKSSLLEKTGGFRAQFDGSQDYDMVLRLTEQAEKIVHIPEILYYWRAHQNSVAQAIEAKPYVIEAAKGAIAEHLERVGLKGAVEDSVVPSMYRIRYTIEREDMVSIIIANRDHVQDLRTCIDSIYRLTSYKNFEIIIVENNSVQEETWAYYEELKQFDNITVVTWHDQDGKFNYSSINNFGAKYAKGEYILLLNNDVEIISQDWIQEMLMFAQRKDVGAVGVKLYYPDDTIQHAGIGIGLLTLAGHYHRYFDRRHPGYMGRLIYAHNVSAVTAACVMIPKRVWDKVHGLDESFEVAFNDVDLCMRIRKAGYLIVWTPYAELYHYESKSRGCEDTPEKKKRFEGEVRRFQERWSKELEAGDPYYNPNLTLDREDFSLR